MSEIGKLVAGLRPKAEKGPRPLVLRPRQGEPNKPEAGFLEDAVPALTAFELTQLQGEQARVESPRHKPGPDPRKPWAPKGKAEVMSLAQAKAEFAKDKAPFSKAGWKALGLRHPAELRRLNEAKDKAKAGLSLTKAQRKLLGKELRKVPPRARALAAWRARQGKEQG